MDPVIEVEGSSSIKVEITVTRAPACQLHRASVDVHDTRVVEGHLHERERVVELVVRTGVIECISAREVI